MAAKLAAEQAEDEEALVAAAELPRKKMQQAGRPKKSPGEATLTQGKSNRKLPGSAILRVEVSASLKQKYAEEMHEAQNDFASKKDFWRAQVAKYGVSKQALKNILDKKDYWKTLDAQPALKVQRKIQNKKRTRAEGGGRKVPFPEIIAKMKQWLSMERACGHRISKTDLLSEFMSHLQKRAIDLRKESEDPSISALTKAQLVSSAKERELRKEKLLKSLNYRKSQKAMLVKWLGAKYMSTELVANLSATEFKARCLLTWQEFDRTLWLACLSSEKTLAETHRVSKPQDFIAARPQLVIGFSDQVPVWAKSTGRRAVFAEEELHQPEAVKDFSGIREAIAQVMHAPTPAEMLVEPLAAPGSPAIVKKASSESVATPAKESVVRKLSFESASSPASQQVAAASPPAEEVPQPSAIPELPDVGSRTLIGVSGDDRFRITYEARQLLFNVCGSPDTEIQGAVGKGLLVVPGHWARLSNISPQGTWIKTESFKVGEKVIHREAGHSVGRILEPYRKIRAEHPELMSKIELMSQPASNVDSVILKWCIESQAEEYPCSVWQRDCFSSVFSDAATESMALANQLSCLVAKKCTSKLQITDTDFSKQFKALLRNKLSELRTEWQKEAQQEDSVFKIGPLQIVQAVVSAQEAMSEKNLKDEWVLRAAVRNALLVYRPNPETQKLEELLTQPWAQKLQLCIGTKRYSPNYLQDRLKWLDSEGVPKEADWSLSETVKAMSDLQVWDYYHKEDSTQETEEPTELDLDGALAGDLEVALENSLSLRVAPALKRAAWRRMGTAEWKAQEESQKKKRTSRNVRTRLRRKHRARLVKAFAEKLKLPGSGSRQEALQDLVPEAKQKKARRS